MNITVNSQPHSVADTSTVISLLGERPAQGTAIAVNGHLVRRQDWDSTPLHEGDEVVIISAAYGG
ncbi:MAG: sulfur carrier protein ThiS [Muribaculaceae bacterium]|nr:sulfur carrier protein ThiS [Bacteroides sp.]MDE6681623.1 sulfur carrier protein ThiS [Muribaculaceae bacterium]MDE6804272.1 sulfur carrier protein ThiS [Muribaculaceae bacterium]MDE7189874.1 sulfur carrier protein ThiS [Muribaculaceae bacterium]